MENPAACQSITSAKPSSAHGSSSIITVFHMLSPSFPGIICSTCKKIEDSLPVIAPTAVCNEPNFCVLPIKARVSLIIKARQNIKTVAFSDALPALLLQFKKDFSPNMFSPQSAGCEPALLPYASHWENASPDPELPHGQSKSPGACSFHWPSQSPE